MEEKEKTSTVFVDAEKISSFLKKLRDFRKESLSAYGSKNLQFYVHLMQNLSQGHSGRAPEDIPVYQILLI